MSADCKSDQESSKMQTLSRRRFVKTLAYGTVAGATLFGRPAQAGDRHSAGTNP